MVDQGGAMAVIFDRATKQRSGDEGLHYWAGRIALHRQESSRPVRTSTRWSTRTVGLSWRTVLPCWKATLKKQNGC